MLNIICFHITVFKVSSANGTTVRQPDAFVYIFSITTSFGVVVEKMHAKLLFTPLVSGRIKPAHVRAMIIQEAQQKCFLYEKAFVRVDFTKNWEVIPHIHCGVFVLQI